VIDWNVLGKICLILSEEEEAILKEDEEKMSKIQERILGGQIPYRHSIVDDPLQQDILAMDWEHIRYHTPIVMNPSSEKWSDRFYRRVLGNRGEWSSQNQMIKRMLEEYKSTIQWCWDYYCGYDVPADRYYPFVSGPLMKDIGVYFSNISNTPICDPLDIPDDEEDEEDELENARTKLPEFTIKNILPEAQLIAVLPPQSHHLLPEYARNIARKWVELYPEVFDFWDYCKKHEWEREGFLPLIPIKKIVDIIRVHRDK
jgi:5'-3' exonuclease